MKIASLLATLALALFAVSDAANAKVKPASDAVNLAAPASQAVAVAARASNSTTAPVSTATTGGAAKKSPGCGKPATIKTGTYTVTVNGKERQYMVRVPENYDSSKAYRLVFTFHWRGGSMESAVKNAGGWYGLEALAKESTIFVSPNGLNAGWANVGGEDIQLVDAIVKAMDNGLCVNQNLRFATGFSYGGAMSHSVACSRPDVFRAVSIVAGASFSGCAGGTKPIAYHIMHGISDGVIPIATGRQIRDIFVKNNGCQAQNPPEPAAKSGTHIKTEYKGCSAGHPLVWIAFDDGHVAEPADRGKTTWRPAETWSFFSRFN